MRRLARSGPTMGFQRLFLIGFIVSVGLFIAGVFTSPVIAQDVCFTDTAYIFCFNGTDVDTIGWASQEAYYNWVDADERTRRVYYSGFCTNCCTTYIGWHALEGFAYGGVAGDDCGVGHGALEIDLWTNRLYSVFREYDSTRSIRRRNTDGSAVETVIDSIGNATGIALDTAAGRVYWGSYIYIDSVTSVGSIRRANLQGQDEEVIITGLQEPFDLAVDIGGGKLYWTDRKVGKIQRANLSDGRNVEDLVLTGRFGALGIDIDTRTGKMYWANWAAAKIQRSNLDGSDVEDIVSRYRATALTLVTREPTAVEVQSNKFDLHVRLGLNGARFLFALPYDGTVTIDIFDVLGRKIARLCDKVLSPGVQDITWNGEDSHGRSVAPGVYLYKVAFANETRLGKVALLK